MIEWPSTAEHGDVLMLAGILQTNTTLTAFDFKPENLNDDDQELLGRALLKHRAGRVGYCSNFNLHQPVRSVVDEVARAEAAKAEAAAKASPAKGKGSKAKEKERERQQREREKEKERQKQEAMQEAKPDVPISYDVKDRDVIRSARSFVLLAGILKANQVSTPTHDSHTTSALSTSFASSKPYTQQAVHTPLGARASRAAGHHTPDPEVARPQPHPAPRGGAPLQRHDEAAPPRTRTRPRLHL